MFKRIKGGDKGFESVAISAITVAVGDALMYDYENEVCILGTSDMTPERFAGIAVADATTADTSVLIQKPEEFDEYIVDTNTTTATTDNYHRLALADEDQVTIGADDTTDTGVFMQLGIVGATTDKKIRGRFVTRMDRAA
jgi:hypothetical protein